VRCQATHRTAQSALSSALIVKIYLRVVSLSGPSSAALIVYTRGCLNERNIHYIGKDISRNIAFYEHPRVRETRISTLFVREATGAGLKKLTKGGKARRVKFFAGNSSQLGCQRRKKKLQEVPTP
jgi:hypothetical protein